MATLYVATGAEGSGRHQDCSDDIGDVNVGLALAPIPENQEMPWIARQPSNEVVTNAVRLDGRPTTLPNRNT